MDDQVPEPLKKYIDQRILTLLALDKDELVAIWRKMRVAAATWLGAMNELSPERREKDFVAEVPCPRCGCQMETYHNGDPVPLLVGKCENCGFRLEM